MALWGLGATVCAGEVEIRFVAADRDGKPPVSRLVDFRRAPDGGLIAVQWASGATLGQAALFPVRSISNLAPELPEPGKANQRKDDVDDLLTDINKKKAKGNETRPVDAVDPLYRGKTLSDGRKVGPLRTRKSVVAVDVGVPAVIEPGRVAVAPRDAQIEVPCYGVTITAVVDGDESRAVEFIPRLTWKDRDLLADCLFEHSPDLPLGDTSVKGANPTTLEGRLQATRGGNRPFRKLTIYLPVLNRDEPPYVLGGHSFTVTADGVLLKDAAGAPRQTVLRKKGEFAVEWVLPPIKEEARYDLPVHADLAPGWKLEAGDTLAVPSGVESAAITLRSPSGEAAVLRPSLRLSAAEAVRRHAHLLIAAVGRPDAEPVARVVVLRSAADTAEGRLQLRLSSVTPQGSAPAPKSVAGTLSPWETAPGEGPGAKPFTLQFLEAEQDEFTAKITDLPAGLYALRLALPGTGSIPVPLVIAGRHTVGAATLATYHNRCDYYHGEQVQSSVIVRALADVNVAAKLTLRHESGETTPIGTLTLNCPRGEVRSQFATLSTAGLRLGRYQLILEAPGVIAYPLSFTVYSPVPKTTFALYSWMTGSFSGPVRVGDETVVNLLLDQNPTRFLSPQEMPRFTGQETMPARFHALLVRDPLYPAPEKTATYAAATEREMAVAMRLGLRFAPGYGWGLNSQEASWNPKHTLPEDLARMRRLCSLVTQRHRDFGNFAGLHLNWYPTYGGYWENHPPTDGHAARRSAQLQKEVDELQLETPGAGDAGVLELARRRHQYRVEALPRAYDAWTKLARSLPAGTSDEAISGDPFLVGQPGLTPGRPAYTSFLPISWFDQQSYYPPAYYSSLPVAAVHAYTDYGFSPFQPLWGLDYWAAGVGKKPKWVTTMSNGRDVMLGQALLAVGCGADGVDINGDDPTAARVLARFLSSYGPFFRSLEPASDVAIVTSRSQQIVKGKLVDRWMGYSGGAYFDLYTKLWYARRPPAVLLEEEITPDRLRTFKALFLVNQQVRLPEPAMRALAEYVKAGGLIFKDPATSDDFPGTVYQLKASAPSAWDPNRYQPTRDRMFVATQAGYEGVARSLDELLSRLPPPRVTSDSHRTLLATRTGRDVAVTFAVNDSHPPPGIYHPWNFWSATVLAGEAKLRFDEPYVVYDLLGGGKEIRLQRNAEGRCELLVPFDRSAGRAFVLIRAAIRGVKLSLAERSVGGRIALAAEVIDENGRTVRDPLPFEITLIDDAGREVETVYRALGPGRTLQLPVPVPPRGVTWRVQVRELISGRTVESKVTLEAAPALALAVSRVLVPRPGEVVRFLTGAADEKKDRAEPRRYVVLLDRSQAAGELAKLAERLAAAVRQRGNACSVTVADPLDLIDWPQRWQPTAQDRRYLEEARAGTRILVARSLTTRHGQGEKTRDQPDYLHPESGFGEPGARHRVFSDVILLGTPETNRFLADLHDTVGMKATAHFPAPQSALVQVAFDAFVPGFHALSIQAPDLAGLTEGVDAVLALKRRPETPRPLPPAARTVAGDRQTPLPPLIDEHFGATVRPIAFLGDDSILASADLQSASYFRFDPDGKLRQQWLGKYGLQPSRSGKFLWTSHWWGAPGYLDKIVCCDADAQPLWMMDLPARGGRFQYWQYPGVQTLPDRGSDDLFVAGHRHLARISPQGKTLWRYDDTPTAQDVYSFRFARDLMLHAVSPDGRYVLAATFGVEPYANLVSRFVRPAVLLFDAHTGKVLWEKPDLLINHSACTFASPDRIVLADATPGRKRVLLFDLAGKELWSLARPEGTSAAELTADGKQLIVQPEAERGPLHQVIAEPQGLQAIDLETRSTRAFPLSGAVVAWKVLVATHVLVSTGDGRLTCFTVDGKPVWEQHLGGPCSMAVAADGRIALGTPNGRLRQLDRTGKVLWDFDLMPHNRVRDPAAFVRDYTRTPGAVPTHDPAPAPPPPINERGRGVVEFSRNLAEASVKPMVAGPLKGSASFAVELVGGKTHVLSLGQRVADNRRVRPGEVLHVTVRRTGEAKPVYAAALPLSASWQERTMAWKAPAVGGRFEVTLSHQTAEAGSLPTGVELRNVGVFAVTFPSRNLLAQRIPNAPDGANQIDGKEGREDLLGKAKAAVSEIRYHLPNDVDLQARARGAPPFRATVEYTTPFDGVLSGQNTSWLGKPLSGSTHATLEISFKTPVKLGALAVYEDPAHPSHYTDTFALFARDRKTRQWMQAASVVGNRSPFNLFTFAAVEADAVTYLWLKSPDGHARIAELEAYLAERELLE